jgi:hypothetical protein
MSLLTVVHAGIGLGRNWMIVDAQGNRATGLGNDGYFMHKSYAMATVELLNTGLQMRPGNMPFQRNRDGSYFSYVLAPGRAVARVEGNSLQEFIQNFWRLGL